MKKKTTTKKFPKAKKGYVTVRIAVAVCCKGSIGVRVLGKRDTLHGALDDAFEETVGDAADGYLMERTFKVPPKWAHKKVSPKTKKVRTDYRDAADPTPKEYSKKAGVAKRGAPAQEDES